MLPAAMSVPGSRGDARTPRAPAAMRYAGRVELAAMAALLATAWTTAAAAVWGRWFPAWSSGAAIADRLFGGDSYYTHGPAVLLAGAYLAWRAARRVGWRPAVTRGAALAGWSLVALAASMHLAGVYAAVTFVSGFAAPAMLGGLLLIRGGWAMGRAYAAPVALLLLAAPLPMGWIAELNFALKMRVSHAAAWACGSLLGTPSVVDGSYVYVPAGAGGPVQRLAVENVCSGLRSLIALTWLAALIAAVSRARPWGKAAMLAAAVPVALLCNVGRIALLQVAAYRFGASAAAPGGWAHDSAGAGLFVAAAGLMWGLNKLAMRLARPGRPAERHATHSAPHRIAPVPLAALAIVAAMSCLLARPASSSLGEPVARAAAPSEIVISHDGRSTAFIGCDVPLDASTRRVLATEDCLLRRYADAAGAEPVELLVVYSRTGRQAVHPPEVCLEGVGHEIVAKGEAHASMAAGPAVTMRQLQTRRGGRQSCHLYVYKAGPTWTTSFVRQQAQSVWAGLTGRPVGVALVRVSAEATDGDLAAAQQRAEAVAAAVLGALAEALP